MSANEFAERHPDLISGEPFLVDGQYWRIRPGRKHPDDLVLEWLTQRGWVPMTFLSAGLLAEFLYRNEDVLYPRSEGYMGGDKVFRFLRECVKIGHRDAWRNLEWEKRHKGGQPGLFDEGAA